MKGYVLCSLNTQMQPSRYISIDDNITLLVIPFCILFRLVI